MNFMIPRCYTLVWEKDDGTSHKGDLVSWIEMIRTSLIRADNSYVFN